MKPKIAILAGVVILGVLSVHAQQVETQYDHGYDFSKIKTFVITIPDPWGNSDSEAYAKDAVVKELTAKGWKQVSNESAADALVVLKGSIDKKEITDTYYSGTASDPDGYSGPAGVVSSRVIKETLGRGSVNIFDTKTRQRIFRGVAEDQISHQEKKNRARINRSIEKIFKGFPPRSA